jgi:hypothetical protein
MADFYGLGDISGVGVSARQPTLANSSLKLNAPSCREPSKNSQVGTRLMPALSQSTGFWVHSMYRIEFRYGPRIFFCSKQFGQE